MRWVEKLVAFDFNIKYRKKKTNLVDTSSRRLDIIKSNNTKKLNNICLSILRNKFRNKKYEFELQKNLSIFVTIKLTTSTTHSNHTYDDVNSRITYSNKMILANNNKILDIASSRLLVYQIIKKKRFYLKLREFIIAWLLKL